MKKMLGLLQAMILFTLISYAQDQEGVEIGLRGGVNFQNINGKDENGGQLKNDLITAFHVGLTAAFPITPQFFVQSGVLYSVKGTKSDRNFTGVSAKGTVRLSYIEVPFNFLYKPTLGQGRLLLGFGPYVAWGIGGNVKNVTGSSNTNMDLKFQNTVNSTDANDVVYYRPFDAGGNLFFGYEMSNKVSFQLNAQMGLIKVNPEYVDKVDDQSSFKNTGFGISIGYRL